VRHKIPLEIGLSHLRQRTEDAGPNFDEIASKVAAAGELEGSPGLAEFVSDLVGASSTMAISS